MCDFLERIQVLAQQEHRFGAHAFHGLEFVGRFTDTLGQHHQLACSRDLGSGGVLLQLQGRNRFSNFQQVRRLAVDGTQSVTHLGQNLLLPHHHACIALSALHHRSDRVQFRLVGLAEGRHAQLGISATQGADVARQHAGAFHHVRERLWATHQRLRYRFRQTLRLHQRLARSGQLLSRLVCLTQHPRGNHTQSHHAHSQQGQQAALVRSSCGTAQHGQSDQFIVHTHGVVRTRCIGINITLHTVHGLDLVGVARCACIWRLGRQQIAVALGTCLSFCWSGFPIEQFSKLISERHGAALQKNSSTDAQKCGMLGQDLQVQFLPADACCVDVDGAVKRGGFFCRIFRRDKRLRPPQSR